MKKTNDSQAWELHPRKTHNDSKLTLKQITRVDELTRWGGAYGEVNLGTVVRIKRYDEEVHLPVADLDELIELFTHIRDRAPRPRLDEEAETVSGPLMGLYDDDNRDYPEQGAA